MKRTITRILVGLALLLIVGLAIALTVVSGRARSNALRADSLEAVADTTKQIAGAWERRATQAELGKTAAEAQLKLKPKTSVAITLKIDTVYRDTAIGTPVTETEGVRRSTVDFRQEPVTLHTDLEMDPPPGTARMLNTRIGIDPILLVPRVSCSTERFNGIHRAHVTIDSLPPWVTPQIRAAQADADVCNQRIGFAVSLGKTWWFTAGVALAGFLAGVALAP